jgi:hypothetical protein
VLFHPRDKKTGEIKKIKLPEENVPLSIEQEKPKTLKDNSRYSEYFKQYESLLGMFNRKWITEENFNIDNSK